MKKTANIEPGMKWWQYTICCIIILVGIVFGIELIDMFATKSGEYGSPITIETIQGLDIVESYDFGLIEFADSDGDNTYTFTANYAPINFNGNVNSYSLMFNSQPLQEIEVKSGAISGSLTLIYYDTEGEEITSSKLYVSILFYANNTQISFEIQNNNESVSYFTTYMNYNGANLKLVKEVDNER